MSHANAYGLLGHKIAYSLSPYLHRFAAQELGLGADFTYELFDVATDALDTFLASFRQRGGRGLNITQPHKQHVARLVGAKRHAVNTLQVNATGYASANTDGPGFLAALARLRTTPPGDFVFLGAGGALEALLQTLEERAIAASCWVLSRRAVPLPATRGALTIQTGTLNLENLTKVLAKAPTSVLVQATSGPHSGEDLAALAPALLGFNGIVMDLDYAPASALYRYAQAQGLPCQDGLPMLIEQAREAQRFWWGQTVSFEALQTVAREAMAKRRRF